VTRRYAQRTDVTKQSIVDELRAVGYTVIDLKHPVDLLVTHQGKWPKNTWQMLECKTPNRKDGSVRLRKDQQEQQEFCERHGVRYVTSGFEALLALGERISL
jgi:hypothetical protein